QVNTQMPRARAKLLVEFGKLRDEMMGEHELAVQAYELAMQGDPDGVGAALALLEESIQSERGKGSEPLAEMLAKKSKNRDRGEHQQLCKMLGKVHSALANDEKGLKAYQQANQLDL